MMVMIFMSCTNTLVLYIVCSVKDVIYGANQKRICSVSVSNHPIPEKKIRYRDLTTSQYDC